LSFIHCGGLASFTLSKSFTNAKNNIEALIKSSTGFLSNQLGSFVKDGATFRVACTRDTRLIFDTLLQKMDLPRITHGMPASASCAGLNQGKAIARSL